MQPFKIMKRTLKFYGLSLVILLSLQSCEKWFDVTANNQIKAEDQFSSVDGFKDALMGVYLSMGNGAIYGLNTSYNLVDVLSQQYAAFIAGNTEVGEIQKFNYTHVSSERNIKNMWDKYYFSIANINSLLEHIEKSEFAWYQGEKEIIKGELLGLRAFLHFDLLRFFGRSNYANRPDLQARLTIPYALKYSKDYPVQYSYSETFELMEKDIAESLTLLKFDPISKGTLISNEAMLNINRDGFYDKRKNRMNYYAVKALQARVFSWQGGAKMKDAAEAAEEVIADSYAKLLGQNESVNLNKTIVQEQLFGLKVNNLQNSQFYFDGDLLTNPFALRMQGATVAEVYETEIPEIGAADIRFNTLLINGNAGYVSSKLVNRSMNDLDFNVIPLIKIPEMYYIASEYYASNNLSKAIQLLEKVRESRRIVQPLPANLNSETFSQELLKEYRKEYVAEGQLFFYYKRLGLQHIPNYSASIIADDKIYMLPFPPSEIEFGNREQ